MRIEHFAAAGYALILCACYPSSVTPIVEATSTNIPLPVPTLTPSTTPAPLTEAQQYLSDALDIIQENAYNSQKMDWANLRPKLLMAAKDAKSPPDTYSLIRYVLGEVDRHSSFFTPAEVEELISAEASDFIAPSGKLVEGRLGYVALFGFQVIEEGEVTKHADRIQGILIELSEQNVCGWIVDLRYNSGGNMYPMISGLGALIGEGELGYFRKANYQKTEWFYQNGHVRVGDNIGAQVSHPEFLLEPDEAPVAVLIGQGTISAGEFTAISFRGRPNTRFFGKPSWGMSTNNQGFPIGDGAVINLTTSIAVDRTGQEYGGSILPDVTTATPEQDGAAWLLAQPACAQD